MLGLLCCNAVNSLFKKRIHLYFYDTGGKVLRHTEINTDIVTWTRLLNRAAPSVGPNVDTSASPMAIASQEAIDRKTKLNSVHNESPPSSPLTSHSGGSTPKSPSTPSAYTRLSSLGKDEAPPMNDELPPPIPISEDDFVPSNRINDHPIIPPPREFLGSMEDLARRRASEGSLISPISTNVGPSPVLIHSGEGGQAMTASDRHMYQQHQASRGYQQASHHRSGGGIGGGSMESMPEVRWNTRTMKLHLALHHPEMEPRDLM